MHKQIVTLTKLIALCGFAILFLQRCSSAREKSIEAWEQHEWQLAKASDAEDPAWKISRRKIRQTSFLEYKIEGEIRAAPSTCLEAFNKDIHGLAAGTEHKKYPTYKVTDETENSLLVYVIHNESFPFKNTEMSIRYAFGSGEGGSKTVEWTEAWEEARIQPSRKLKRVETFRGSWAFSPLTVTSSRAVYTLRFDPQGMPRWLFNPMVIKFLKEGLRRIVKNSGQLSSR